MLILEIAVAIVLAVVVLAFLPDIIALGLVALLALIVLGSIALLAAWIFGNTAAMIVAIISIILYMIYDYRSLKKPFNIDDTPEGKIRARRRKLGYLD